MVAVPSQRFWRRRFSLAACWLSSQFAMGTVMVRVCRFFCIEVMRQSQASAWGTASSQRPWAFRMSSTTSRAAPRPACRRVV
jgi:hypothetical protein